MRKVIILSINKIGYFHQFDMQGGALIELENGTVRTLWAGDIQFINKVEDEHLSEFAKAAMQGLLAKNGQTPLYGVQEVVSASIRIANALITELKKQKP